MNRSTPQLLHRNFFFFNDTATTEIYTLSLHDALPISHEFGHLSRSHGRFGSWIYRIRATWRDRKSTRLNSSHSQISYAVFCLKKKKKCSSTSSLVIDTVHGRNIRSRPV